MAHGGHHTTTHMKIHAHLSKNVFGNGVADQGLETCQGPDTGKQTIPKSGGFLPKCK